MKRITAIALLASATFALASTSFAKSSGVEAKVPFDFIVGNTLLPADTYTIKFDSAHPISITKHARPAKVALSLFDEDGKKSPKGAKLLFHKYGGQYFLSDLEIVLAIMMVVVSFAGVGAWSAITSRQKQKEDELERHCITPDQLSQALAREPNLPLFDLREPLDVLVDSEMIPGAWRMCPHRALENPWLLPRNRPAVIYCTSPSDETSRAIVERALAMGFLEIKLLKGGLEAWKAKGYAVKPYFGHTLLDVAS